MLITSSRLAVDPLAGTPARNSQVWCDDHQEQDAACRPAAHPDGDSFELAWMRILAAYDTLHAAGIACPREAEMLRRLRAAARRILATAPASNPECWLVPATPRDVTACHLVAVNLFRHGRQVRLWPWQAPVPGASLTVGANWPTLLRHPAQDRPHDAGMAESA